MYYVYILKSINRQRIYIGYTQDLERRLKEHFEGECASTRELLPMRLVYYEAFASGKDAYERESKLKQYGSGLRNLKMRIVESLKGGAG